MQSGADGLRGTKEQEYEESNKEKEINPKGQAQDMSIQHTARLEPVLICLPPGLTVREILCSKV